MNYYIVFNNAVHFNFLRISKIALLTEKTLHASQVLIVDIIPIRQCNLLNLHKQ